MNKKYILPIIIFIIGGMAVLYLCKTVPKDEIIADTLIHLLAGTLGGFIFLYLVLVFLRPEIAISPYICYRDNAYWFKMVNMSVYHAFDIKIELFKMVPLNHTGGNSNVDIYKINLRTSDWTSINRFRRKYSKKDPFSLYAQIIFTTQDLEQYLVEKGTYLAIQITARHGLTGLADRFTQHFGNENVIRKDHKFCFGADLNTMPANQTF